MTQLFTNRLSKVAFREIWKRHWRTLIFYALPIILIACNWNQDASDDSARLLVQLVKFWGLYKLYMFVAIATVMWLTLKED